MRESLSCFGSPVGGEVSVADDARAPNIEQIRRYSTCTIGEHRRSNDMLKKLTTALGLTLVAGSLAFASQTPSTNPDQAATKPPAAQATPGDPQQQPATTSKSVKKHK